MDPGVGPNCVRCGGVAFVDRPLRLPSGTLVQLVCCAACMGVAGVVRDAKPWDAVRTPFRQNASREWRPDSVPGEP